jgi:Yip1 domain
VNPIIRDLLSAVVLTLRSPRAGARQIMQLEIGRRQGWELLLLIAVLSAGFAYISVSLSSARANLGPDFPAPMAPIALAFAQLVVMVVMVFAIYYVGRATGGTGTLDQTLVLVSWMQFILVCLQIVQIVATVVFPLLALVIGIAGLVLLFWLLTVFVAELHGFNSVIGVFLSVLVVMVVVATVLRFAFGLFGFDIIGVF